ncbi:unnamed protein product, partial [Ectocarpus sp. 12 AP-2014]
GRVLSFTGVDENSQQYAQIHVWCSLPCRRASPGGPAKLKIPKFSFFLPRKAVSTTTRGQHDLLPIANFVNGFIHCLACHFYLLLFSHALDDCTFCLESYVTFSGRLQ